MKLTYLSFGESLIPYYRMAALVVGSGAAGYNAADSLYSLGVRDLAILTEGKMMGTSRNTGSDKQTYYKLNLTGSAPDSVYAMAETLTRGGSMHGDIALTDAALSARGFFKLVSLGVPFPMNEYGEYVGYQTDHDDTRRATSCGPLTSKFMTEALEKAVESKKIKLFDGHRVIKMFSENGRLVALMTIASELVSEKNPMGLALFSAGAVVYAVGGPSAIYADTVYPPSQNSSLGAAFEAGAAGANLTESQYGIASVKFRWNLSGTYQQVLPRYVSTDENGEDEREFLREAFGSDEKMLEAIFLKGYEWPFDPKKTVSGGSSRVDLAVFREREKGRRVFLDYTKNPDALMKAGGLDSAAIPEKAREYLANSDALLETPIARLAKMNTPAIELYRSNGIDLASEKLEVAVSAQHNNGGLAVKLSRESTTLRGLYAVGECAGTFGVYRPGGSALNATQTGSLYAAMDIAKQKAPCPAPSEAILAEIQEEISFLGSLCGEISRDGIFRNRAEAARRMSFSAAFLRDIERVEDAIEKTGAALASFAKDHALSEREYLRDALVNRDILITQLVYLSAIRDYIADGGKSRGSYLVMKSGCDPLMTPPELDTAHAAYVQNTVLKRDYTVESTFEPCRPIPESEQWFEKVWNRFREEAEN